MSRETDLSILNRREALKLLGAAGGALWSRRVASGSPRPDVERVIVVGAGTAGLSAARALSRAGVDTVVVEGRDRIGGRTHATEIAGTSIDLGAAWVQGRSQANPVRRALSLLGVPVTPDVDNGRLFESGTGFVSPAVLNGLWRQYRNFHQGLPALRREVGRRASVADGIAAYVAREGLTGVERDRVIFVLRTFIEDSYAGAAEDMSLTWYWRDSGFPGVSGFPEGTYMSLVGPLAEGMEIRLGHRAQRIEYGAGSVSVVTDRETFEGSHVIVTVPLGVLKAGDIEFSPALRGKKRRAIAALAMGNLEKVILRFDEAVPDLAEERYYRSATRGEYPYFKDMTAMAGAPTLIAFCAGDFGRNLANIDPDAAAARVLAIAREISTGPVPDPIGSLVTNWTSDPFAGGSYSFVPTGAKRKHQRRLAAPTGKGRVLFAGEATEPRYYATVHGAMISGMREASRLLGTDIDADTLFA